MADTIAIEIRNVVKRYGDVTALKGASLTIRDNEFFTLLGPSGCGKTTLLRMIAGFEDVTDGAIFLFGEEIENLSPHQRPINTVFQQYALFPHMTVAQNVAFGLKMLGRSKADCDNRAAEMLALVKLSDFAARYPAQLSGGQQQRVALARALAPGPKVLLLDEPLSALDLKLRQDMRVELKQLQKETGITFVFVTHDQEEALTMSDRIAVMSDGEIRQIGAPAEIYEVPADRFVADFIGETNILNVKIASLTQGVATCTLGDTEIQCPAVQGLAVGAAASLSIRPERITIDPSREAATLQGAVSQLVYLGTDTQAFVDLDGGQQVMVRTQNAHGTTPRVAEGDHVGLSIDPGAARLLVD